MTPSDPLGWFGTTVDERYLIEAAVGEGGFGIVYRATHLGFEEPVAVKFLKLPAALGEEERATFLREVRDEARLLHKLSRKTTGIVQALDVGAAVSPAGVWMPYMVMEWLEGLTLDDKLKELAARGGPTLAPRDALSLLAPVAESLAIAHAEKIVHTDLKPSNIFLLDGGGAKLLDFGIAKVMHSSGTMARAITRAGTLPPFTPAYGAPEQFNPRHGAVGPWTDVFALALLYIEVCSGKLGLDGKNPVQFYVASANEQVRPSLAARGVTASRQIEDVLHRAVQVDSRRRYPHVQAMWEALKAAVDLPWTPRSAPRVSMGPTPRKPRTESADTVRFETIPPKTGLNRLCTVFFAEISCARAAEQLDAEQVAELLDQSLHILSSAVTALGGAVERVLVDGMMAYFGLYEDSATAAERAIHAALRCQRELAELATKMGLASDLAPAVRAGISTGKLFVSPEQVTGGYKLHAIGAPVKLAGRLQQTAAEGELLVDRDTYRQVSGRFVAEQLPPPVGQTASQGAYRITGPSESKHALDMEGTREFYGRFTRLVGRVAEMDALLGAAASASEDRRPQLVTAVGPPGIGTSRLLVEVADELSRRQWLVLSATGSVLKERAGNALVATVLRSAFHIHDDDGADVVGSKLRRGLREIQERTKSDSDLPPPVVATNRLLDEVDDDEIVEQMMKLLGRGADRSEATSSEDEASAVKNQLAASLATLLSRSRAPVAIVCDDVHWADESSLLLLDDLCVRLSGSPVFILLGAQPELLERFPGWGEGAQHHQRLSIQPLGRRHLEEMVRDRLQRVAALSAESVRRLAEHAEGSPLALVETLHLLIDTGSIDTQTDEWIFHAERASLVELPTTVMGVVQARLDRLASPARLLLARAAVVGPAFWDGLLAVLDPDSDLQADLQPLLGILRDRGLVRARASSTFPDQREYVFAESATHRVAYEMLGRKDRRRLHALVARWLEPRLSPDAGAALIAHHYENAADLGRALVAYRRAGTSAASLGQNAEARDSLERACRIDEWMAGDGEPTAGTAELYQAWGRSDAERPPWPDRVGLRAELGDVLRRMGHFDLAEQSYRRAESLVPESDRPKTGDIEEVPRWRARLFYRIAVLRKLQGRTDVALAEIDDALAEAQFGDVGEEEAEMWALAASLHRRERRYDACRDACLRGLRKCRRMPQHGSRWRQAVSKLLNALGGMLQAQGRLVSAHRCYTQAVRITNERRNPDQASRALNNVGAVRYAQGDLHEARTCFREALKLAERSGDSWVKTTLLANVGEVELALGRNETALDYLGAARKLSTELRASIDLAEINRNLARAHGGLGAFDAALRHADEALRIADGDASQAYRAGVLLTAADTSAAALSSDALRSRAEDLARRVLASLEARPIAPADDTRCRDVLKTSGFDVTLAEPRGA
jgi:serine/threonine protein kinase/tetratricopeptide (TPR) repeat protein